MLGLLMDPEEEPESLIERIVQVAYGSQGLFEEDNVYNTDSLVSLLMNLCERSDE